MSPGSETAEAPNVGEGDPMDSMELGSREPDEGAPQEPLHPHARGLIAVGLFKLSKALFFAALGAGALKLIHHDIGDVVQRVVDALRITSESSLARFLMDRADLIGHHQLRQASMFAFSYAALCLIEGWGLVMQKVWAEYFTVILTMAALPWESYELLERYTIFKLGLLVINLVVLGYLLWVLKKKKRPEMA